MSSSIVLWRSYLYYEYYCGNYNNAKHVFYSAINKCPYSKVLWTDAIRVLRPLMKNEEIVNVIAYCQSKDIFINNNLSQECVCLLKGVRCCEGEEWSEAL